MSSWCCRLARNRTNKGPRLTVAVVYPRQYTRLGWSVFTVLLARLLARWLVAKRFFLSFQQRFWRYSYSWYARLTGTPVFPLLKPY